MTEHKTEVIVNAKAKGFQQVQQQAGKLMDAATKAAATQAKGYTKLEGNTKAYRAEIKKLESSLRSLEKQQLQTLKALGQTDRTSKAYKALHEQFRNLNAEAQRLAQQKGFVQKLYGPKGPGGRPLTDADMARGGFMQGFAGSMGIPLQRGPGMWRQAAGVAAGTMLKGAAGAPFGGVSGVAQGLAGIPVVGGFAAGQFNNAMQFGEGALGVQRSRLGMAPFLGASESGGNVAEARRRGRAGVRASQFLPEGQTKFAGDREIGQAADEAVRKETAAWQSEQVEPLQRLKRGLIDTGKIILKGGIGAGAGGALGPIGTAAGGLYAAGKQFMRGRQQGSLYERANAAELAAVEKAGAPEVAYRKAQDAAGETAARRERAEPFKEIRAAGLKYGGMSEADALQAAQGVLQVSGGGMTDLRESGMLPTAFAAQTKYGLGADITGAFAGAGRTGRGGLVGLGGEGVTSAEKMTIAIQDGLSMGLEGSELQEYMAQMAQGIQSWKSTGIPINPASIAGLGMAVTNNTALGGLRGSAIGRGLATAAQGVSETGVQDAVDLQMLQTMGGFKGGSLEDYEAAQVKMEEMGGPGGWGPEQMKEMVTKLTEAGGGGASGRYVLRKAFGRKGIKMSQAETIALEKAMTGQELTEHEEGLKGKIMSKIDTAQENMPMDAEDLQAQAAEIMKGYGANVQRASGIQNDQNAVGERMITTLQSLQDSQVKVTRIFDNLAGGGLTKISGLIEAFTTSLANISGNADLAAKSLGLVADVIKTF